MSGVVATRCVEAGVDFSFRSAFRDLSACPAQAGSWGLENRLQFAGRVSRAGIADCRFQIGCMAGVLPLLKPDQKGFEPL